MPMKTVGIVAEYNPFHLGHERHIRESRRIVGEDCGIIAVMSGDFVQRGDVAVYSKFARAEAACRCGVNLVVELPLPWSLSSAETFSAGAVYLLNALGAEVLSFGSETADLTALQEVAAIIAEPNLPTEVRSYLKNHPAASFASARQRVMEDRLGKSVSYMQKPNSILALEYLKAIINQNCPIQPLAIYREGAGHDERGENVLPSAAELRERLYTGASIHGAVPRMAAAIFDREQQNGRQVTDRSTIDLLMLSRLRFIREQDFLDLPDAGNGLGRRLYRAVQRENSYERILQAASTKRYPMARIRRLCVSAALGLKGEETAALPPFARVLAFDEKGKLLLHQAARHAGVPILTKAAQVSELSVYAQHIFDAGSRAHDFFTLMYPEKAQRDCGVDWRTGPAIC